MEIFCVNLNIHYSAPQRVWDEIERIYTEMPYWKGFVAWHPDNEASAKLFSEYGFGIVGTDEDGAVRAGLQLDD